jgi:hypothetical protein
MLFGIWSLTRGHNRESRYFQAMTWKQTVPETALGLGHRPSRQKSYTNPRVALIPARFDAVANPWRADVTFDGSSCPGSDRPTSSAH